MLDHVQYQEDIIQETAQASYFAVGALIVFQSPVSPAEVLTVARVSTTSVVQVNERGGAAELYFSMGFEFVLLLGMVCGKLFCLKRFMKVIQNFKWDYYTNFIYLLYKHSENPCQTDWLHCYVLPYFTCRTAHIRYRFIINYNIDYDFA